MKRIAKHYVGLSCHGACDSDAYVAVDESTQTMWICKDGVKLLRLSGIREGQKLAAEIYAWSDRLDKETLPLEHTE